ncbi:MAG: hypothetical protein ACAI34_14480 [Verrucomicrobium sp.]
MIPTFLRSQASGYRRGTALIITVFFVALLTLMVVAFFESARSDRASASSHLDRNRAGWLAQEGVEAVVATLQRETSAPRRRPDETDTAYTARKRNWVTQPGALIVPENPPADQKLLVRRVELSSGLPTKASHVNAIFDAPDLNAPMISERLSSTRLITDRKDPATCQPVTMPLRWIYVRQNVATGEQTLDDAEEPLLTDKVRPVVGRYAYWADDESSKINYNLAWKRNPGNAPSAKPNRNSTSHPSRVNLMALNLPDGKAMTESMADALHQWTVSTPARHFNSFAEARQLEPVAPGVSEMLDYNKFELTHYNHDPDTTFFGEERILLTTNRDLVPRNPDGTFARKFIDIMRDDVSTEEADPGELDYLAGGQQDWLLDKTGKQIVPNKFDAVVRDLMRYISEKNWPLVPGVSFKDKYYPGTEDSDIRLAQIVINIIDYVRAKESAKKFIAPLRFAAGPDGKYTLHATYAYAANVSYQGVSRSPYVTEAGMWMEKDAAVPPTPLPAGWPKTANGTPETLYKCYYKSEFYLPPQYGVDEGIDLVPDTSPKPKANESMGWVMGLTGVSTTTPIYYFRGPSGNLVSMSGSSDAVRIFKEDVSGGEGPNQTVLMPGRRVVVTKMFYRDKSYAERKTVNLRVGLIYSTSNANGMLTVLGRWPRITLCPQFGQINQTMSDPAKTPMADMLTFETDDPRAHGHPNDWAANTSGKNSLGSVNSRSTVGKPPLAVQPQQDTDVDGKITDASLYMPPPKGTGTNDVDHDNGRIVSVGELGYVVTGNDTKTGGVPWRTLRLQPNDYEEAGTLPDWALLDLFSIPNSNGNSGGSMLRPHDTAVGGRINVNSHVEPFDHMTRDRGLLALVAGSSSVRLPASEIAGNIYRFSLATGNFRGKAYGYPWKAAPVAGSPNAYDTPGEICEIKGVADGGEESEALVREIVSLVTTRGGVFSVYTVGQALKQTPSGGLTVTAEQRQHAVVERYLNNRGTDNAADDEVQFKTIYFRNLNP